MRVTVDNYSIRVSEAVVSEAERLKRERTVFY